jgi:hypothetical protein
MKTTKKSVGMICSSRSDPDTRREYKKEAILAGTNRLSDVVLYKSDQSRNCHLNYNTCTTGIEGLLLHGT